MVAYLRVLDSRPCHHEHAQVEAPHQKVPVPFPLHETERNLESACKNCKEGDEIAGKTPYKSAYRG